MKKSSLFLTDAQFKSEIERCEYCEDKPCKDACPCDCSPADFIMAAKTGITSDIKRSAAIILKSNPIGGICGLVCPDTLCMDACSHKLFDGPLNIPAIQATIIEKAKQLNVIPKFSKPLSNRKKVAVIGSGPAGLGAAAVLAQKGYTVDIYEKSGKSGGMTNCIPPYRLSKKVIKTDIEFLLKLGKINLKLKNEIKNPETLINKGYSAVISAVGLWEPIKLGIPNEKKAIAGTDYLQKPSSYKLKGKKVVVIGGGATAADCAVTAKIKGAATVEMIALESIGEMPLTAKERGELIEHSIEITGRTRVTSILSGNGRIKGIKTLKLHLPKGKKFHPAAVKDIPGTVQTRNDIQKVIIAIGNRSTYPKDKIALKTGRPLPIFNAGDFITGPTTVVEATACGKNAAEMADAYIQKTKKPRIKKLTKSHTVISGYNPVPVSLETDFFGKKLISPFLLSAAPPSDGIEQMKLAFESGWAGGIMKTAFDNVPIHIPGEYMNSFDKLTFGNCDNVSGHPLKRVAGEVKQLVKMYPERLVAASTGGPVTGNDKKDRSGWQSNTKILEDAGVMAIEYSLSCPQGGDGTEGDIVSQNANLTAKIIDWILEAGEPGIPKLFKLTAAVTSIQPIILAIKKVFKKHKKAKAGITLANTFPTLCFKPGRKKEWEEGVVVGMSGQGVTPVSYLTLSTAGNMGIEISGNGGPMNYKAAANFLALGVQTVQFCTIVEKYGYDIIKELNSGLSHLMADRKIKSVDQLIGIAQPDSITDFMSLTPVKKISTCDIELCVSCGNCKRCPYLAISFDRKKHPVTDPEKCIGCTMCNYMCFTGALSMRKRTKKETRQLKED